MDHRGRKMVKESTEAIFSPEDGNKFRKYVPSLPGSDPYDSLGDYLRQATNPSLRRSEDEIVETIKNGITEATADIFTEADKVLNQFFEAARIKDIDKETGEITYRQTVDGRFVEHWGLISRSEAEQFIWGLQHCILALEAVLTDFYMKAQIAHVNYDESHQEHYSELEDGTIQDRTAYARKHTKETRYAYLVAHLYWKSIKERVDGYRETRKMAEYLLMRNKQQGPSGSISSRQEDVVYT